jgi:hypothetical protein
MLLKYKYLSLLLFLLLILSIMIMRLTDNSKGYKLEMAQPGVFEWEIFEPRIKDNIAPKFESKLHDSLYKKMTLDLNFLPQFRDPKLYESTFMIEMRNAGDNFLIYEGKFKDRLVLESVLYQQKTTFIQFWAFHENSQTYLSWISKHDYPIFVGKPLYIELYEGYNEDADALFKISSVVPSGS